MNPLWTILGSISKTVVILALVAACYPEQKRGIFHQTDSFCIMGQESLLFWLDGGWFCRQVHSDLLPYFWSTFKGKRTTSHLISIFALHYSTTVCQKASANLGPFHILRRSCFGPKKWYFHQTLQPNHSFISWKVLWKGQFFCQTKIVQALFQKRMGFRWKEIFQGSRPRGYCHPLFGYVFVFLMFLLIQSICTLISHFSVATLNF
jgi:hypothetical protein